MASTVFLHDFAHVLVQLGAVLGFGHIDEVDHDDASHITQAQLPGYLVGGKQVHVQRVAFLVSTGA